MFKAICSNCGKECEVPFRPTGSKPVYCSECFEKRSRDAGHDNFSDRGPQRPSFENRGGGGGGESQSRELSAISAKLDKIIALLTPVTPKQVEASAKDEVVAEKPKKKIAKKSTSTKKE